MKMFGFYKTPELEHGKKRNKMSNMMRKIGKVKKKNR